MPNFFCARLRLSQCHCHLVLLLLRIILSVIALALALGYGLEDFLNGQLNTAFALLPLAATAFLILRLDHQQLQNWQCVDRR